MELQHRPSQCDKCGYGTGSPLTLSVSQDRAMSELVARLHAAEIAAEVEGLQPNRLLLTDSGSLSDKSATGVIGRKGIPPTESTAATDTANPVQQDPQVIYPQADPTIAHKGRRLSDARDTKAAAKTSAITLPLDLSTPISRSRFHKDIPNAARSTPTLTTTPGHAPDAFTERSLAASMAAHLPTTQKAALPTPAKNYTQPKHKSRVRFRPTIRWAWTGLRKKPKAIDPEQ
jgi:hypothetical protein